MATYLDLSEQQKRLVSIIDDLSSRGDFPDFRTTACEYRRKSGNLLFCLDLSLELYKWSCCSCYLDSAENAVFQLASYLYNIVNSDSFRNQEFKMLETSKP